MVAGRRRAWLAWAGAGLVLVAGCGGRGQASHAEDEPAGVAAYANVEAVPEQLSLDGTTISVGDPKAAVTVHLMEDPRCPYCEKFERTGGGPVLAAAVIRREVRAQFTMASFLDDRLGGGGSKRAVNALRAALEAGKFTEYHAVLYSNQPPEETDGFTTARLLELAARVPGLRSPAFDSAVKTMKYRAFVTASEEDYEAKGTEEGVGPGTPSAEIDSYPLPSNAVLYDAPAFTELLRVSRGDQAS
ncbi:thioredoxin domain-containing protein [Streptomyces melanogenes]|uniref:thioredoxin domain-containing protein n=1 Tax=Streptomyces melanogenes TaxID=67326 RepID=UPI0037998828